MSKGKIYFAPGGGLGNRMRALDSAYNLALQLNKDLVVFWYCDSQLNAKFKDLFTVKDILVIESTYFRAFFRHNTGLMRFFLRVVRKLFFENVFYQKEVKSHVKDIKFAKKTLILQTGQRFFYSESNYEFLIPKIEFRSYSNCVGVHIRRGDHKISSEVSTLDKFIGVMNREIESDSSVCFLLATDSEEVKSDLKELFHDRITTFESSLDRDNTQGLRDALLEIYSLSSTKKVLGSYTSSFSEVASEIGGIELEIVQ